MNGHPTRKEDFDLYALGVLEGEEKQAIETHVAGCALCAQKLAEARGRIALLALSAPPHSPPPQVRERLLRQVRGEIRTPETLRLEERPSLFARWWGVAWAPVALVLALSTIYLWVSNDRLNRQLEDLRAATARQKAEQENARRLLDLATARDSLAVTLASTADLPGTSGRVLYNARLGVVLYNGILPAPPADKTYQLWLVPVSGDPVSAGVFSSTANGSGSILMTPLPPGIAAKAFAVTLEPAGGRPQPTGPKVQIGAAS
jgi:anti-sigma-K factor RskA